MLKYKIEYEHGATGEPEVHEGQLDLKTYKKTGTYISEDLADMAYTMSDKGYYKIFLWRPTRAAWELVADSFTDFTKPRRKWV